MSSQALPPLLPRNHLARLLCNAYSACRHQSPKDHQAANLPAQNNSASSRSVRSLPVQSFVHCALLKRESGAGFGMASDVIDRDGLVCGVEQPRILSSLKRAHCIIVFAGNQPTVVQPSSETWIYIMLWIHYYSHATLFTYIMMAQTYSFRSDRHVARRLDSSGGLGRKNTPNSLPR